MIEEKEIELMIPFSSQNVADVFANYEEPFKSSLLEIRELIFDVAGQKEGVGEIAESLKWGQPTYSTLETKSGTPIRIDQFDDENIGLFFHCQTTLIEQLREMYPQELTFSKNRAILLDATKPLPLSELKFCISRALVYHKNNIGRYGL